MSKVLNSQSRQTLRGRLLVSTASAVCGMAMLAPPAQADTIPPECEVINQATVEINCAVPAPETLGQIYTTTDNTYVRVGTVDTPTSLVFDGGDAVIMTGEEQLVLLVRDGSSVTSSQGIGALLAGSGDAGVFVLGDGNFTGQTDGVRIFQAGTGSLVVSANDIIGVTGTGLAIDRSTSGPGMHLTTAGTVAGSVDGVNITDSSEGSLYGSFNNAFGGDNGIFIDKNGDGDITLAVDGNLVGAAGEALHIDHLGSGDVNVFTAGDLTGGTRSVWIELDESGDVTFINQGTITGEAQIRSRSMSGEVTAIINDVAGDDLVAVVALEPGSATSATLVATGHVDGYLYARAFDGDVQISSQSVTTNNASVAAVYGISSGAGNLDLIAEGDVLARRIGVLAVNEATGRISIETQSVTSTETTGIGAIQSIGAQGDIYILAHGDIASGETAIFARHEGDGNVEITAEGLLDAQTTGVKVLHSGDGIIDVDVMGDIAAQTDGIFVQRGDDMNGPFGDGDIYVSTAGAISADRGIVVEHRGSGDIAIDAAGDVSGSSVGVYAMATDGTVDLTASGTVAGDQFGVDISGAGVIASLNAVESADTAVNMFSSAGIDAAIASAFGGKYGVFASSENGDLILDIGDAVGTDQSGIELYAWEGIDLTVRGHVYGSDAGIRLYGEADQTWNVAIAEGALVESEGFAFDMNALGGTGQLTLVNKGTIDGESGSGVFLSNSSDADLFENYGVVTGQVQLGAGDDVIRNGGTFQGTLYGNAGADSLVNSGTFTGSVGDVDGIMIDNNEGALFEVVHTLGLDLGGGTFANAGTLSSGGADNVFTSTVNGSFVQTGTGSMLIDVDGVSGTADHLDIVGDANLAGTVDVNFVAPAAAQQEFLIVATGGGTLTDSGLALGGTYPVSPLVMLGLDFRNANELYLTSVVDFTPDGAVLNPNQEEIADEIGDIFGADPDALGDLTDGLFGLEDLDSYGDAIKQLVPEIYLNTRQTSLLAAQDFSSELGGCSGRDGRLLADGKSCAKLVMGGDLLDRDASFEQIGFENGTLKLQAEYFMPLGETLTLGLGLGYDDTLLKNDVRSRAQGHRYQLGTSLTHRDGGLAIGGTLSAGFTNYDVSRRIFFGDFASQSDGNQKMRALTGELVASYTADLSDVSLKPAVSLVATHLRANGLVETGGKATDYAIERSADWHLAARPSLEVSGDFASGNGLRIQPYVRGGATVLFDEDFALAGRFADAGDLGDGFATTSELDRTTIDVDAGLRIMIGKNSALNAEYAGRFSDDQHSHGFRFRASFAF